MSTNLRQISVTRARFVFSFAMLHHGSFISRYAFYQAGETYLIKPFQKPLTPLNQTYNASIRSTLPALLSAVRQNPPAAGPPHDGKTIGRDLVTYTYKQVTLS